MNGKTAEVRLHSRYDPAGEAFRYIEANLAGRRPSCIVILGGGEDWLSEAARTRFPNALILSVQLDTRFRGQERPGASLLWYPDCSVRLRDFLAAAVPGHIDGGIAVLPWKPSQQALPDAAEYALHEVRTALEEASSDAATSRFWSGRWMRNALCNFLAADRYAILPRGEAPIVIAAAGPSLEQALRTLRPFQARVRLWALSSASAACLKEGWEPELLISTDPGFWADRHFDAILRSLPAACPPLAAHPTARVPRRLLELCPLVLLSQGDIPEMDLAAAAGLTAHPVPSRGTVSADALCLARKATRGAVILAGLDLASRDILSHCRPYGFDFHQVRGEGRLLPGLSLVWKRELSSFPVRTGSWRRARAFDLYAGGLVAESASDIHRLLPSPVPVPGVLPLAPSGLDLLLPGTARTGDGRLELIEAPSHSARSAIVLAALRSWEVEAEAAVRGAAEITLTTRSRRLLLALGGQGAAPFLAEAARGAFDPDEARRTLDSVRSTAARLAGLAS